MKTGKEEKDEWASWDRSLIQRKLWQQRGAAERRYRNHARTVILNKVVFEGKKLQDIGPEKTLNFPEKSS